MVYRTIVAGLALSMLLAIAVQAADAPAKQQAAKKAVNELVLPAQKTDNPEAKHFITNWLLLGPFTFGEDDFGGYPQTAAIDKEYMPKEGDLDGTQAPPKEAKDVKLEAKNFNDADMVGMIDLGGTEHATMYAVALVNSPEEIKDAQLLVGSDDYVKVWVNGKLVHTFKEACRNAEPDQDKVTGINLKKGENRIVVKCVNVGGEWVYYLRLADKDGKAYVVKTPAPAK